MREGYGRRHDERSGEQKVDPAFARMVRNETKLVAILSRHAAPALQVAGSRVLSRQHSLHSGRGRTLQHLRRFAARGSEERSVKIKSSMHFSRAAQVVLYALLLILVRLTAQTAAFDFYPEFRKSWFALPDGQRGPMEAVTERYQARLRSEGVDAHEISRRIDLIRNRRPELESDFWNRFFTVDAPAFNTAPNSWLVSVLDGRKPGRALDVGMGEGRNTLYLARQGWDVTGFDPAGKAVALAESRAQQQGLKIHTQVSLDRDFDFGQEQWDLILFSWMPVNLPARTADALRPGGVVVVESPEAWYPVNGLLRTFEGLRILRYEDRQQPADFFNRREMPVVRLLAEKPNN